jgi:hypothetical protein
MSGELVLRERDVRVSSAEPIADAVADECHRPVRITCALDGLLLAGPAPDARRVGRDERERSPIPRVGDDREVVQAGRCEERFDVEAEAVRDDGEREPFVRGPGCERSERGVDRTVRQCERDQLLVVGAERRGFSLEDVAQPDRSGLERMVDPGEVTIARCVGSEPSQQIDSDIVQAHGAVEVHHDRSDRQHPSRLAAWEHARMDLAERIVAAGLEGERVRAEVVEGGEVLEVDGLLVALSNLPASELNGTRVMRDPDDAPTALEAARAVFRARGHPFFGIEVEVGRHPAVEAAIRAAGMRCVDAWPTMAAPIADLPPEQVLDGVTIREARHEGDLEAVRSVEVATFGTPRDIAEGFVGTRMLEDDRVKIFTAWIDGEPVGEASGYLLHDTVGIFGVGVVEATRRRGIGAALTLRAARAFPDQTDLAWLQPSDMARTLYGALGFRPVSDWEVWIARERG